MFNITYKCSWRKEDKKKQNDNAINPPRLLKCWKTPTQLEWWLPTTTTWLQTWWASSLSPLIISLPQAYYEYNVIIPNFPAQKHWKSPGLALGQLGGVQIWRNQYHCLSDGDQLWYIASLLICMRIWQLTWFDMFVRHCSLLKGWSRKPKCKRDIAIMAGAGDLKKVLCLTLPCFLTLSTWKLCYGQVFVFNPTRHHIWVQYIQIINSNFGPNDRNGWGLVPLCLVFHRFSNP